MPWFPIKGIVKKLRLERGWSREELVKLSGVKPRTVRLWESDSIPRTGQDDTVRGFAAAFGTEPEILADWLAYDPDVDDRDDAAGGAPTKSTLATRASRDEIPEWITRPQGPSFELIRPRLLNRIKTAPGLCAETRYAIMGKVRDHRDMPPIVAGVLGFKSSVCGQFLVVRRGHNGDVCYASAFTATAEQTAQLLDTADAKATVTFIARIVLREPDKEFKGFFIFQKKGEKPKAHKWCFVIEQIIDGEVSIHFGEAEGSKSDPRNGAPVKRRSKIPRSNLPLRSKADISSADTQ